MGWLIFSLADIRDDFFLAVALVQNILKQRKKRNRKTRREDMKGNDDFVRTFPFFMSFPLCCRISWLIFSLENYFDFLFRR